MIFFRQFDRPKALSFDLDDTLYDNLPHMLRSEKALLNYIVDNYPNAADKELSFWRSHKKAVLSSRPELMSDMAELRRLTLTAGMAASGYTGEHLAKSVEDCFDYFYFERSNFKVEQHVLDLLAELAKVTPLVAITNGNVNLHQIGISDYFSACFKANIDSPMKPDQHMYLLACEHLQLAPEQILHVGDNMQKDVWGAYQAGLKSAWYACDRKMCLSQEQTLVLPDVQLAQLTELRDIIS